MFRPETVESLYPLSLVSDALITHPFRSPDQILGMCLGTVVATARLAEVTGDESRMHSLMHALSAWSREQTIPTPAGERKVKDLAAEVLTRMDGTNN